ncbi:MAG: hypothetical protein Q9211_004786 [Gyalolechia sp. 1 TL-2023]
MVVMLLVRLDTGRGAVVVGAENGPGEHAMRVPFPGEAGVEFGEEGPRRPAEDVEESTVRGGVPRGRGARVEDDEGVRVGGRELGGEKDAGDVEDALMARGIETYVEAFEDAIEFTAAPWFALAEEPRAQSVGPKRHVAEKHTIDEVVGGVA